jgi:hypothetical protein
MTDSNTDALIETKQEPASRAALVPILDGIVPIHAACSNDRSSCGLMIGRPDARFKFCAFPAGSLPEAKDNL